MPGRKLSQADLDDLREADAELLRSNPRRITRQNGHGHAIEITTLKGLAEWKGISESHFFTHKRNGFQLRRGKPYEDKASETVPLDAYESTVRMFKQWVAELESELAKCHARIAELENNQ